MPSPALDLQADALEHALIAALPLGPQSAAGGVSLPDSFHGELQVRMLPLHLVATNRKRYHPGGATHSVRQGRRRVGCWFVPELLPAIDL